MLTEDQLKALDTSSNEIDLSGIASDDMSLSWGSSVGGITTISVPPLTTSQITSIPGGTVGGILYTGASASYTYNTNWCTPSYTIGQVATTPNTIKIDTDGIKMQEGTDIKIGERSLSEFMTKMEERLAILVPDPEKLEKFEALRKAYEHYKLMEKLCQVEKKEEKS